MKYAVVRERYWPEGIYVVEIAMGGMDMVNPDMMSPKFQSLGEGKEFDNAEEALGAALKIQKAWRNIAHGEDISIAAGCTMGMTVPFEPSTKKELKKWAERRVELDAQEEEQQAGMEEDYA